MLDAQEAASGKKWGVAQRDGDTKQGRFSARTVLVLNSDDPPCLVLLNLVHLSFALSRATAKVAMGRCCLTVSAPALLRWLLEAWLEAGGSGGSSEMPHPAAKKQASCGP